MKFSTDVLKSPEQLAQAGADLALNILAALAIFFVGKAIARGLVRLLQTATRRARLDETLSDFLANVLYGLGMAVIIIAAAGTLGIDTASATAVVGGAALAIGLSLQNQLSSFAAGVIIIVMRPFSKGDDVEVGGGIKGTVEEIKIVSTQLRTADNKRVIVPNASITTNVITNYTALGTRRAEFVISVSHQADLLAAKRAIAETLAAEPRLQKLPEATVRVRDIGPVAVELEVWAWLRVDEMAAVRAALLEAIKLRLVADGIEVPAPDGRTRLPPRTD